MYQNLILVGNLGKDPELRYTPDGSAVTNFSLATHRRFTDSSGERSEETTWFRVSVWGRTAESCAEYLRKGSRVLVEGRLTPDPGTGSPRLWTRRNGSTAASYDVTAHRVVFLSGRTERATDEREAEVDALPF